MPASQSYNNRQIALSSKAGKSINPGKKAEQIKINNSSVSSDQDTGTNIIYYYHICIQYY